MTGSLEDATHLYEVQARHTYAARDGFRIRELTLARQQEVPWHLHTRIGDTFYVLAGEMQLELRAPDEVVHLGVGKSFEVVAGRPHRVTSASEAPVNFIILQGVGTYDYVPQDP